MNVYLGVALQIGATFFFTLMGAMVRYLGTRVPLGEVLFFRSGVALLPLLLMLAWRRELGRALRMRNPNAHFFRGLTGVIAMAAMFAGLARLPLADATAIGFAAPLISVALAAVFLGEIVGIWRWSAVAAGLVGVLIMLSPHLGEGPQDQTSALGAIFTLSGAFLVAAAMTQVRHLSASETTASLVFSFSMLATFASVFTIPFGWTWPGPGDAVALIAAGIFGGVAQIMLTESYRHASAGVVAPFSYFAMLWAVVLGYVAFGEVPELAVLAGAVVVIGAGIVVILRERKLGLDRTRAMQAETPPGPQPV